MEYQHDEVEMVPGLPGGQQAKEGARIYLPSAPYGKERVDDGPDHVWNPEVQKPPAPHGKCAHRPPLPPVGIAMNKHRSAEKEEGLNCKPAEGIDAR